MARAVKDVQVIDYSRWKGIKHDRCGSKILSSGVVVPIEALIHTEKESGRQYYVSGIAVSEGKTEIKTVFLHKFIDNGEVKRMVLNEQIPKWKQR